jgi:hypothetical protein
MMNKQALEKILKGIIYTGYKSNIINKEQEILNLKRRRDKYSESSIVLAAYLEILNKEK